MKKYHLQVRYSIDGWVNKYPNEVYSEQELLGWTNVEDAPSYTDMKKYAEENKILHQRIRVISDDGEWFYIGANAQTDYPHKVSHLHESNKTSL